MGNRVIMAIILICIFPVICFANAEKWPIAYEPDGSGYLTDRVIVTALVGVPPLNIGQVEGDGVDTGVPEIDDLCLKYGVISIEAFYSAPVKSPNLKELLARMYIFRLSPESDVISVLEAFRGNPVIETADLYLIPKLCYIPNDPQINQQWFLRRTKTYEGWDILRGDPTKAAVVGITDSGIYWTHPDLEANMWINEPEDINHNGLFDSGDNNGVDEDSNGYIDDVIGWDMANHDNDPREPFPLHGTAIAGCASEVTDNNLGGAGIGFSVRLMAVKICDESGNVVAPYQAVIYAADNGAPVINCSWGRTGGFSQSEQNIMTAVWNDGHVIVASAGNHPDSTRTYPAAYENVLAVAATDSTDHLWPMSTRGSWVDLCAPGDAIYTPWGPDGYITSSGTSEASPVASGLLGLVYAHDQSCDNVRLVRNLLNSCDKIDSLNPRIDLGIGRINTFRALNDDYISGDINGSGHFNGIDIIYGVNFLKGIGDPPPYFNNCLPHENGLYPAADINGDCEFNGLDISYAVNYLKGPGGEPQYCPDCPPGCR